MFLRRDFLDAWIVVASGSTIVDPYQCGDVALPVSLRPATRRGSIGVLEPRTIRRHLRGSRWLCVHHPEETARCLVSGHAAAGCGNENMGAAHGSLLAAGKRQAVHAQE